MKAWQFENPITHERFTISDTQMADLNFIDSNGFYTWAKERGYELVKTFDLGDEEKPEAKHIHDLEDIDEMVEKMNRNFKDRCFKETINNIIKTTKGNTK